MINNISINDKNTFNKLGLLLNNKFDKLFILENLLESENDYIYGYYIDDVLVGFIHVNKLYENMDIVNIVVDDKYRRQHIGQQLLDYVIDKISGVDNILLEVNENNKSAINFYTVNNFKVINTRKNYYGTESALIMKRDVKNERC